MEKLSEGPNNKFYRKCSPIILYVGSHQFCSSAPEDSTFVSESKRFDLILSLIGHSELGRDCKGY